MFFQGLKMKVPPCQELVDALPKESQNSPGRAGTWAARATNLRSQFFQHRLSVALSQHHFRLRDFLQNHPEVHKKPEWNRGTQIKPSTEDSQKWSHVLMKQYETNLCSQKTSEKPGPSCF